MIREGVMQKYNYMSEHDTCTFRTSSRILRKFNLLATQTVAYIRSLIYVSSQATRCVVSVPVNKFIAAHPNKREITQNGSSN